MGERPNQDANGTCFGRSRGASATLVKRPSVGRACVDEQRVHGSVEQHNVAARVQRVQGIEVTNHQKRTFHPLVLVALALSLRGL